MDDAVDAMDDRRRRAMRWFGGRAVNMRDEVGGWWCGGDATRRRDAGDVAMATTMREIAKGDFKFNSHDTFAIVAGCTTTRQLEPVH